MGIVKSSLQQLIILQHQESAVSTALRDMKKSKEFAALARILRKDTHKGPSVI